MRPIVNLLAVLALTLSSSCVFVSRDSVEARNKLVTMVKDDIESVNKEQGAFFPLWLESEKTRMFGSTYVSASKDIRSAGAESEETREARFVASLKNVMDLIDKKASAPAIWKARLEFDASLLARINDMSVKELEAAERMQNTIKAMTPSTGGSDVAKPN